MQDLLPLHHLRIFTRIDLYLELEECEIVLLLAFNGSNNVPIASVELGVLRVTAHCDLIHRSCFLL